MWLICLLGIIVQMFNLFNIMRVKSTNKDIAWAVITDC